MTSCLEDDRFGNGGRRARVRPLWCGQHLCKAALPPFVSFATRLSSLRSREKALGKHTKQEMRNEQKLTKRIMMKETLTRSKGTKSPVTDAQAIEIASPKPLCTRSIASRAASAQIEATSSRRHPFASVSSPSTSRTDNTAPPATTIGVDCSYRSTNPRAGSPPL